MLGNMYMACLTKSGNNDIKNSYKIKYSILSKSSIFEFLEFLIIGRNKPRTYNRMIISEAINILLIAFSFIKVILLLVSGTIQQSCKVYDLYQADILIFHPMRQLLHLKNQVARKYISHLIILRKLLIA